MKKNLKVSPNWVTLVMDDLKEAGDYQVIHVTWKYAVIQGTCTAYQEMRVLCSGGEIDYTITNLISLGESRDSYTVRPRLCEGDLILEISSSSKCSVIMLGVVVDGFYGS